MTRRVVSVTPETSVVEAVRLMLENRISGLPVIDDAGQLVGIVTEGGSSDAAKRGPSATGRAGSSFCWGRAASPRIMYAAMAARSSR
jgi:CBS-domain-containing membrane protein